MECNFQKKKHTRRKGTFKKQLNKRRTSSKTDKFTAGTNRADFNKTRENQR